MQLDAVADPIRLRVLRHLEQHDGASLRELADAAGVHVNTLRPHLRALTEAAVLSAGAARSSGAGRPPIHYHLAEDWVQPGSDLRGLAEVLASAVSHSHVPTDEAARAWAAELPGSGRHAEDLPLALGRLGFDAHVDRDRLQLAACPCPLVAPGRPEAICGLAMCVAEGVLARCDGNLELCARTHDPQNRRCGARLRKRRAR